MPLLPPEPNCYPQNLFEATDFDLGGERLWWVLHTKPRQEKSLARQLHEKQIPFYLPLTDRKSRIRGRLVTSHNPLFPGYVFLIGDRDERVGALATNRVVQTLAVPDQQELWDDLRQVYRLIASGQPISTEDRLAPGDHVEIQSGPLMGLRGRIVRAGGSQRFVVAVNFIHQGASVIVDETTLAKVQPLP